MRISIDAAERATQQDQQEHGKDQGAKPCDHIKDDVGHYHLENSVAAAMWTQFGDTVFTSRRVVHPKPHLIPLSRLDASAASVGLCPLVAAMSSQSLFHVQGKRQLELHPDARGVNVGLHPEFAAGSARQYSGYWPGCGPWTGDSGARAWSPAHARC